MAEGIRLEAAARVASQLVDDAVQTAVLALDAIAHLPADDPAALALRESIGELMQRIDALDVAASNVVDLRD